jgi:cell division topological specificity factor
MALLDFIQKLLGLQKPSAEMAKERLQLVLAHDRSDLNPELLEQMRREILEVVQRYVEIDLEEGDVSLATEDRVTALVANLPIRRARPKPLPLVQKPLASPGDEEQEPDADAESPSQPEAIDGEAPSVNPAEDGPETAPAAQTS